MSDYRMNIRGEIGLTEYSNIYDYLSIVNSNDRFTINIDDSNKQEINIISSMLRCNKFCVYDEGYDVSGSYYINAYKMK